MGKSPRVRTVCYISVDEVDIPLENIHPDNIQDVDDVYVSTLSPKKILKAIEELPLMRADRLLIGLESLAKD